MGPPPVGLFMSLAIFTRSSKSAQVQKTRADSGRRGTGYPLVCLPIIKIRIRTLVDPTCKSAWTDPTCTNIQALVPAIKSCFNFLSRRKTSSLVQGAMLRCRNGKNSETTGKMGPYKSALVSAPRAATAA